MKPTYTDSHRKNDYLFFSGQEWFKKGIEDDLNSLLLKIQASGESLYKICPHIKKVEWVNGWKYAQLNERSES